MNGPVQVAKPVGTAATGRASSCRATKAMDAGAVRNDRRVLRREDYQVDDLGIVQPSLLAPGSFEVKPTKFPGTAFSVSAFQHMGDRRTQEDRFAIVPTLDCGTQAASLIGVFDGTVGDFASENVRDLIVPKLIESQSWKALKQGSSRLSDQEARLLETTQRELYRSVDDALLHRCAMARPAQHYATCTSVTVMVVGDILVVSHLGDSRVVLGKEAENSRGERELVGEQMTQDHKPDLEGERDRIEKCGGTVERLQNHHHKPFLRGGDFLMRKALGEAPMQLQYARAFGAKDLKMFGLSNVPDVKMIRMGTGEYKKCRVVILATDGLWDVVTAQEAVTIAKDASLTDENPAEALVRYALLEQSRKKARADNITVVCVFLD